EYLRKVAGLLLGGAGQERVLDGVEVPAAGGEVFAGRVALGEGAGEQLDRARAGQVVLLGGAGVQPGVLRLHRLRVGRGQVVVRLRGQRVSGVDRGEVVAQQQLVRGRQGEVQHAGLVEDLAEQAGPFGVAGGAELAHDAHGPEDVAGLVLRTGGLALGPAQGEVARGRAVAALV